MAHLPTRAFGRTGGDIIEEEAAILRDAARGALIRRGLEPSRERWAMLPLFGRPNIARLKEQRDVDRLIRALSYEKDLEVRIRARDALVEIGDAAVEPLIAALRDAEFEALRDAEFEACISAVDALGDIGDGRAVEPLLRAVQSGDSDVLRSSALRALERVGGLNASAVEPLIAVLEDRYSFVRTQAAEALGKIGDGRAVGPLLHALQEGNPFLESSGSRLRLSALTALKSVGGLNAGAVEPLAAALRDADASVRAKAAEALGDIGDERAVESLVAALFDPNGEVTIQAAEALGKIRSEHAVEPLIAALRVPLSDSVRREAAALLGKLGDERAVEPLIAALRDEVLSVRIAAARAVGNIGDGRAVEPLIAALQDTQPGVVSSAAEALGKLGDERAVEPLVGAIEERDGDWLGAACAALTAVLERSQPNADPDALRRVIRLEDTIRELPGEQPWGYVPPAAVHLRDADCTRAKQIARQELMRRGLEA